MVVTVIMVLSLLLFFMLFISFGYGVDVRMGVLISWEGSETVWRAHRTARLSVWVVM